jgi:hypothetical protein
LIHVLKGLKSLEKETFADLGKIRLEILKKKMQDGIKEFKDDPKKQWIPIRFEKPLLETLLDLIEKEER